MIRRRLTKATRPICSAPRHPGGRPTSYRPEYVELVRNYALLGAKDEEIARLFGVSLPTLKNWKGLYPEFLSALKDGKAVADGRMAESLYHSGIGYSHPAVKIFMTHDKNGNPTPYRVPYIEHHPPNSTSMIFWLKNRRPDLWRDKRDVEMSGPDGGPIKVQKVESRVIDADFVDITEQVVGQLEDTEPRSGLPTVQTSVR